MSEKKNDLFKRLIASGWKMSQARQASYTFQELVVVSFAIVVLFVANKLTISIVEIISFGYLLSKFLGNINDVSGLVSNGLEMIPSISALNERGVITSIKYVEEEVVDHRKTSEIVSTFKIKNFTVYDDNRIYLDHGQLELFLGDKVRIVGENGIGKSTFLKSLVGLVPSSGEVYINGKELERKAKTYLNYFSYASQEVSLFNAGIIDNVTLFNRDKKDELYRILKNLKIDLNDFFINWSEYQIKENGEGLSGGQKQILNILRALVSGAPILLIDEFSNHLSWNVVELFSNYFKSENSKIFIFISHKEHDFINKTISFREKKLNLLQEDI